MRVPLSILVDAVGKFTEVFCGCVYLACAHYHFHKCPFSIIKTYDGIGFKAGFITIVEH